MRPRNSGTRSADRCCSARRSDSSCLRCLRLLRCLRSLILLCSLLGLRLHRRFSFRMFHNGTNSLFVRLNRRFERFDHLLIFGSNSACNSVCNLGDVRVGILRNFCSVVRVKVNVHIFYSCLNNIHAFYHFFGTDNDLSLNGLVIHLLNGFRSRDSRSAISAKCRAIDEFLTAIQAKHNGTSLENEFFLPIENSQRISD